MSTIFGTRTLIRLAVFVGSMILSFLALSWLLGATVTIIVLASLFLHELGHYTVLRSLGHRGWIVFVPFLGAAVIAENRAVMNSLSRPQAAAVSLAGPLMNVLIMFGALAAVINPSWRQEGLVVASINAFLAVFNLLPFLFFDGAHVARALFGGLSRSRTDRVSYVLSRLCIGLFATTGVFWVLGVGAFNVYGALMAIGIASKSVQVERGQVRRLPMRQELRVRYAAIYGILISSSLLATSLLPFWRDV